MYLFGAIRNAESIGNFFPGWVARFYVGSSVSNDVCKRLSACGAEVVPMQGKEDASAMFWRFLAFSDPNVELALSRDCDSRFTKREAAAVQEWLASGKTFHIIRDHPYHDCCMLGGLWGAWTASLSHLAGLVYASQPKGFYNEDQLFLKKYVYPLTRGNACVHDSFFCREKDSRPFPMQREEHYSFIGEAYDEHDIPRQADRDTLAKAESSTYYYLALRLKSKIRSLLE